MNREILSKREYQRYIKRHASLSRGVSSRLLHRLASHYCTTLRRAKESRHARRITPYCGTFAIDEALAFAPTLKRLPRWVVIINLQHAKHYHSERHIGRNRPSSGHFVCVRASGQKITYVDPNGGHPSTEPDIVAFIQKSRPSLKSLAYNDMPVQRKGSVLCGMYALLYVLQVAGSHNAAHGCDHSYSAPSFFPLRPNDSLAQRAKKGDMNDRLCLKYVKNMV